MILPGVSSVPIHLASSCEIPFPPAQPKSSTLAKFVFVHFSVRRPVRRTIGASCQWALTCGRAVVSRGAIASLDVGYTSNKRQHEHAQSARHFPPQKHAKRNTPLGKGGNLVLGSCRRGSFVEKRGSLISSRRRRRRRLGDSGDSTNRSGDRHRPSVMGCGL